MFAEKRIKKNQQNNWSGAVVWDKQHMQQALMNLYQNAIDAMPEGGELHVEVEPISESELEILINDTGIGILQKSSLKSLTYILRPRIKVRGLD